MGTKKNPLNVSVKLTSHCQLCRLQTAPAPDLLENCANERLTSSRPVSNDVLVPHMQMDLADRVEYTFSGQTKQFPADTDFLEKTVDTVLFRYFWTVGQLQETGPLQYLDEAMAEKLDAQLKLPVSERKELIVPTIAITHKVGSIQRSYGYHPFAFAAKADLLAKRLYQYKNQHASLLYMGTFFSTEFFKNRLRYQEEDYPVDLPPFQLEDYIYYELQTRCSFAVETCAALLEIPQEDREICRNVLRQFYRKIFSVPFILSRITLVRQCIHEAKLVLENVQFNEAYVLHADAYRKNPEELKRLKFDITANVVECILNSRIWDPPTEDLCKVSSEDLQACQGRLHCLLERIKAPVDIVSYISEKPYGPIAFCNLRHPHVAEMLHNVFEVNADPSKIFSILSQEKSSKNPNLCHNLFQNVYNDIKSVLPKGLPLTPDSR